MTTHRNLHRAAWLSGLFVTGVVAFSGGEGGLLTYTYEFLLGPWRGDVGILRLLEVGAIAISTIIVVEVLLRRAGNQPQFWLRTFPTFVIAIPIALLLVLCEDRLAIQAHQAQATRDSFLTWHDPAHSLADVPWLLRLPAIFGLICTACLALWSVEQCFLWLIRHSRAASKE